METLESTQDSRLIVVSRYAANELSHILGDGICRNFPHYYNNLYSGGMYNTKFPQWEDATATGSKPYDGQFAYAYAKRGQVLLCERWAAAHPKVVSPFILLCFKSSHQPPLPCLTSKLILSVLHSLIVTIILIIIFRSRWYPVILAGHSQMVLRLHMGKTKVTWR